MIRTFSGPAIALAILASTPATAATLITQVFSATTPNGVGLFTASQSGTYIVTAAGASGGGARGGSGAIMTAEFTFNAGDVFTVNIGVVGTTSSLAGGGGGGTFFAAGMSSFIPMLVAGGGGGGAFGSTNAFVTNTHGRDASFGQAGTSGGGSVDGVYTGYFGGLPTNTGGSSTSVNGNSSGGGGGGFSGSQIDRFAQPLDVGASFLAVVASERESRTGMPTRVNGGTAVGMSGGGGGGYGGGGMGNDRRQPNQGSSFDFGGGGGGGSFVAAGARLMATDRNRGDGWLTIDFVTTTPPPPIADPAAPVPEPTTWTMMIGGFCLVGGAMRRRRLTSAITYA